jgi:hypothetical protein
MVQCFAVKTSAGAISVPLQATRNDPLSLTAPMAPTASSAGSGANEPSMIDWLIWQATSTGRAG